MEVGENATYDAIAMTMLNSEGELISMYMPNMAEFDADSGKVNQVMWIVDQYWTIIWRMCDNDGGIHGVANPKPYYVPDAGMHLLN